MRATLEVIEPGEVIEQITAEEASTITTQTAVNLDAIADNDAAMMPPDASLSYPGDGVMSLA